jgi:hypothetical protein
MFDDIHGDAGVKLAGLKKARQITCVAVDDFILCVPSSGFLNRATPSCRNVGAEPQPTSKTLLHPSNAFRKASLI